MNNKASAERLMELRRQSLEGPRVFLAYVEEDLAAADRLFRSLAAAGFDPWLDRRKLLPGENWPHAIEQAIETSDFFIACFSNQSVWKKSAFQAEIRYALECAGRVPLDDPFLIPVRFEECRVPWKIRRELQYIDLFPNWEEGVKRIVEMMWCRPPGLRPAPRPGSC